jgi:hypothetical protein
MGMTICGDARWRDSGNLWALLGRRNLVPRAPEFELVDYLLTSDPSAIRGSPEWRAKIGAANRGRKPSPETLARLSAIRRGRKQTPEHIAKRSLSRSKGDEINYNQAHKRARLNLAGQPCMACGSPDRVECALIAGAGTRVWRGKRFSPDPEDYLPLCFDCHIWYDLLDAPAPIRPRRKRK